MSLDIKTNYSLRDYNTFAIDATADEFVEINSVADLQAAIQTCGSEQVLVLGGGSNLLFEKQRIQQPVFWINLKGIQLEHEDESRVLVRAMAGENWHDFVMWCVQHDYGGLENLSLIPGSVGAAPVQNIGAYGVEIKDSVQEVVAVSLVDGQQYSFSPEECRFSYRDSVFKHGDGKQWIIVSVTFGLTRHQHKLHMDYGAIRQTLQDAQIEHPSIRDVSDAVISIRQQKLPDPKLIPNAGSFFKNPVTDVNVFREMQAAHPDMPGYELPDAKVKIPAGWLIEQCGWKGKSQGPCAVHDQHALVLVNNGGASGADILALASAIRSSVEQQFALRLEFEVNLSSGAGFS